MVIKGHCRHCEDDLLVIERCDLCDADLTDQCLDCHHEVAHGQIEMQNVALCGGRNAVDDAPDNADEDEADANRLYEDTPSKPDDE